MAYSQRLGLRDEMLEITAVGFEIETVQMAMGVD
jgi:hypothetical protein